MGCGSSALPREEESRKARDDQGCAADKPPRRQRFRSVLEDMQNAPKMADHSCAAQPNNNSKQPMPLQGAPPQQSSILAAMPSFHQRLSTATNTSSSTVARSPRQRAEGSASRFLIEVVVTDLEATPSPNVGGALHEIDDTIFGEQMASATSTVLLSPGGASTCSARPLRVSATTPNHLSCHDLDDNSMTSTTPRSDSMLVTPIHFGTNSKSGHQHHRHHHCSPPQQAQLVIHVSHTPSPHQGGTSDASTGTSTTVHATFPSLQHEVSSSNCSSVAISSLDDEDHRAE